MKLIRNLFLLTFLIAMPIQQSKALVAAITTIWNPTTAGYIAISGLASPIVGAVISYATSEEDGCEGGACVVGLVLGGMLGLVLLDEQGGNVEFSKLSDDQAQKLNISVNDQKVFNSELEEANLLLSEVASQMKKDSTQEDARAAWNEYRDYLSPATFKVMKRITEQN
jgi:hypothetical protein